MTRNKKIAEQMGWAYNPNDYIKGTPHFFCTAKLLQDKMVADGWTVDMRAFRNGCFEFSAILPHSLSPNSERQFHKSEADTEPAAIVDLFCKVYGITDEN